jgi:hypothetical protein
LTTPDIAVLGLLYLREYISSIDSDMRETEEANEANGNI